MDFLRNALDWLSGNSRHLNDAQKEEIHKILVVLRREMDNERQSSDRHQTQQFSEMMRNTRTINEKKYTDIQHKVELQGAVLKTELNQVTQQVDEKTDSLDRKIDTVTREYDEQLKMLKDKVKELENVRQPQDEKKKEEKTEKEDEINRLAESLKELMMTMRSRNQTPPNVSSYPHPDQYDRYTMPVPGPNSGYFPPPAHFHPTKNPYPWPDPAMQYSYQPIHPQQRPVHPSYNSSAVKSPPPPYDRPGPSSLPNYPTSHHENANTPHCYADNRANNNKPFGENDSGQRGGRGKPYSGRGRPVPGPNSGCFPSSAHFHPTQNPDPAMQYSHQPMHPQQRPVHPSYNSSAVQSPPPPYDRSGPSSLPNHASSQHGNVNAPHCYADNRTNNDKPFGENDSGQRGGRGKPYSSRGNRGNTFFRGNQGRGGGNFHPRNNHFDGKKFHKNEKQSFSENDTRNFKPSTRCHSQTENSDSDASFRTKDTNKNQQNRTRYRPKTSEKFQFNSHNSCDGNDSDTSTTSQMSSVSSCSKFSNKKKQFNPQHKYANNSRKPHLSSDNRNVKSEVLTNENFERSSSTNSKSSDLKKLQYLPKAEALQKGKDLHKPFDTPVTCLGKANGVPVSRVANSLAEIYAFEECYGTCQLIQY